MRIKYVLPFLLLFLLVGCAAKEEKEEAEPAENIPPVRLKFSFEQSHMSTIRSLLMVFFDRLATKRLE